MAFLGYEFNINDVPEREDFTPIPAGTYTSMVVASEMKPTRDLTGEYLELEIEVIEGPNAGRKLFERLNLKNKNQQAVDIAHRTLGEIVRAVGKVTIKDSDELHNKRMSIVVEVEQGKPYTKEGVTKEGKPQNVIKKYMAVGVGAGASAGTGTPGHVTASETPGGAPLSGAPVPPWKR